MGTFAVDDGQLALYLVFTFISLAISIAAYCLYFHGCKFSDADYSQHIKFFAKVSAMNEREATQNEGEVPLIE